MFTALWAAALWVGLDKKSLLLMANLAYGLGLAHCALWLGSIGTSGRTLMSAQLLLSSMIAASPSLSARTRIFIATGGLLMAPFLIGRTPCTIQGGKALGYVISHSPWWMPRHGVVCSLEEPKTPSSAGLLLHRELSTQLSLQASFPAIRGTPLISIPEVSPPRTDVPRRR